MYIANETRYDKMVYNRCGASGLLLPAVSLGLWHNFGSNASFENMMDIWQIITARLPGRPRKISAAS